MKFIGKCKGGLILHKQIREEIEEHVIFSYIPRSLLILEYYYYSKEIFKEKTI